MVCGGEGRNSNAAAVGSNKDLWRGGIGGRFRDSEFFTGDGSERIGGSGEILELSAVWTLSIPRESIGLERLRCLCKDISSAVRVRALEENGSLNRALPLEKLHILLRRAPQLVELGAGSFAAEVRSDTFSNLADAFSGCKQLKGLFGFWDVTPAYLPLLPAI
nr:protein TRANSPORT INHIBITOR RESPONSE 1-like [Ipomoea batatas]